MIVGDSDAFFTNPVELSATVMFVTSPESISAAIKNSSAAAQRASLNVNDFYGIDPKLASWRGIVGK